MAKGECGPDHYQVRLYQAWYGHITLAMPAGNRASWNPGRQARTAKRRWCSAVTHARGLDKRQRRRAVGQCCGMRLPPPTVGCVHSVLRK